MTTYNEIEPYAAAWLRNLIEAGHIAPGEVDERSIADLKPEDIHGPQAHFFAGIGAWSYALRLAGVSDGAPVWTGSCPCQPFSSAGKGLGEGDPRHLWPAWRELIAECRPAVVFGEQVASPAGRAWLGAVRADLEALGYRVGAADLCAAGVGAPHIRQRLFFGAVRLGNTDSVRAWWDRRPGAREEAEGSGERVSAGCLGDGAGSPSAAVRVEDADVQRREEQRLHLQPGAARPEVLEAAGRGEALRVADADHAGLEGWPLQRRDHPKEPGSTAERDSRDALRVADAVQPGRAQGRSGAGDRSIAWSSWDDCIWLPGRDGKTRPASAEPGAFPVAHGATARVGRLRAYGNAIVPQVAAAFVVSFLGAIG